MLRPLVLLLSLSCCYARTVEWMPKFFDGTKGWLDCGVRFIHLEDVRLVSGNCSASMNEAYRLACEGRHTCDLRAVTPASFGCHREGHPTLYYTSTCYEETPYQTVNVTRGNNQIIDCGSDKVIHIRSANYSMGTCGYNVRIPVEGLCGRRHTCDLNPANFGKSTWFTYDNYYGTRCGGTPADRTVFVDYYCAPPHTENADFFAMTADNEEMVLTCPVDTRIFIKRGYYGYGDNHDDTTVTVRGICSGQSPNRCAYTPWKPEFSDFDGYWDFNIVYYYCSKDLTMRGMQTVYVAEGQKVNMRCEEGSVMDFKSAYYGAGGFQVDVMVPTKAQCQNRGSCAFVANNEIFMDPRGQTKHFTASYLCRPRRWNDLTYTTITHDQLGTIDCYGDYINIEEAFYGTGYMQEDVTASRFWDRCESRWPEPFRNSYCAFGARDIYFGNVSPSGKLTVGYFCSTFYNGDGYERRTRRYLYGTGVNRDTSYYYPGGDYIGNY